MPPSIESRQYKTLSFHWKHAVFEDQVKYDRICKMDPYVRIIP